MLRFYFVICTFIVTIIYNIFKMRKWTKSDKHTFEEKYLYGKDMIRRIKKRGRITIVRDGLENLPKEGGYIMFPNHQGKFDAQCIIDAHPTPCRYVIGSKQKGKPLVTEFTAMLDAKWIDHKNVREQVGVFSKITEEVKEGYRYFIFPEGGYDDNHNNLIDFKSGCFTPVVRTGCPIVPVCLYDAWKIFGVNSLKKVTAFVYFLKPIYYEEYKDLRKNEISELVKTRINEKLNELKRQERLLKESKKIGKNSLVK